MGDLGVGEPPYEVIKIDGCIQRDDGDGTFTDAEVDADRKSVV